MIMTSRDGHVWQHQYMGDTARLELPAYHLHGYFRRTKRYLPMPATAAAAAAADDSTTSAATSSAVTSGKMMSTIEIANVQVHAKFRNQGHFRRFLQHVEQIFLPLGYCVYVECVHSEILAAALSRYGYTHLSHIASFVKYPPVLVLHNRL